MPNDVPPEQTRLTASGQNVAAARGWQHVFPGLAQIRQSIFGIALIIVGRALIRAAGHHGVGLQRKPRIHAADPLHFGELICRTGQHCRSRIGYSSTNPKNALVQLIIRRIPADVSVE